MASKTEFWVKLAGATHDANTGWHCSALAIPSARIASIVIDGNTRALDDFRIAGSSIRVAGKLPQPIPDAAVLISIDRKLVRLDKAVLVAIIGVVGTLGAAWMTQKTAQATPLPLQAVARASPCGEEPRDLPPAALPVSGPSDGTPSLMSVFRNGNKQEFAGNGTAQPPVCTLVDGILKVEVRKGYRGFAGCYVDLPTAMDLTAFLNGNVSIGLQSAARQLELKLESISDKGEKQEKFLVQRPAEAGTRRYKVESVPKDLIARVTRLTVAVANEPDKANTITVRP